MKSFLSFLLSCLLVGTLFAGTAANFTCTDCNGVSHDFYTEIEAGKVIVLCWVMPCGACTLVGMTDYNVVKTFQTSNPGRVLFYLVDDYANTNCTSLGSWADAYNMKASAFSARFSNSSIRMSDYGSEGMPKTAVVGGPNHEILYTAENSIDGKALQSAISNGLALTSDVPDQESVVCGIDVVPNPSVDVANISLSLNQPSLMTVDVLNTLGQPMVDQRTENLCAGVNHLNVDTSVLPDGVYYLALHSRTQVYMVQLVVAH